VQALSEQNFPVWQNDGRHVTATTVNFIAKQFVVNFCDNEINDDNFFDFWVPFVNSAGKISGRLYTDNRIISN